MGTHAEADKRQLASESADQLLSGEAQRRGSTRDTPGPITMRRGMEQFHAIHRGRQLEMMMKREVRIPWRRLRGPAR